MPRGSPEKQPAPSTLKARRRRSPIFIDEPIQWHLRTTKHDRCPWCGLQDLDKYGGRKRVCMNVACGITIELPMGVSAWLESLYEDDHVNLVPPVFQLHIIERNVFALKEAQLRSNVGRGRLTLLASGFDRVSVFWHREGRVPETSDGQRCCAPGSPYWRVLLPLRKEEVWVPDDELCEMEVLAKAYGTDEPMFAIMAP